MSSSPPLTAHPLTERLIRSVAEHPLGGPVIEVGTGSGRNTRALIAASIPTVGVADATPYTQLPGVRDTYGAALSTHAYLHGPTAKLRAGMAELRRVLQAGSPAYLTLGSIKDARYGFGTAFDERTFAPGDGDEAGIPHAYFDRDGVVELLSGYAIESMEEVEVDAIAGRWSHPNDDLTGRVHWFIVARAT